MKDHSFLYARLRLLHLRRKLFGDYSFLGHYKIHPDKNQENFFFALLQECIKDGSVTEERVRNEMLLDHVRKDAPSVLRRAPPIEQVLEAIPQAA